MFENLTGSYTENINIFNYKKILKANMYYSLFNRKDNNNSVLNWGESLLIKVRNNDFVYNDIVIINSYNTSYRFTVLKVLGDWLIINMLDTTSTINFVKFSNELTSKEYFVTNQIIKRSIVEAYPTNTYNYLNVEMRSLDSFSTYPDFGEMVLKVDDIGTLVCYNMSYTFFINFQKNKISSLSFDLCHKTSEYIPIIRNLKFKEKKTDSIIFEYFTNNNKQYIVFTTKQFETDYSIYPDTFYNLNSFISLSNDYKVHQQYSNYINDLSLFDSLQTNTLVNIPTGQIKYCKELFGNETISKYTVADSNYTTAITLTNPSSQLKCPLDKFIERFKIGDYLKLNNSNLYHIINYTDSGDGTVLVDIFPSIASAPASYAIVVNDVVKTDVVIGEVSDYGDNTASLFLVDTITATNGSPTLTTTVDLRNYFTNNDTIVLMNVATQVQVEYTVHSTTPVTNTTITLSANYNETTGSTQIFASYYKPFLDVDLIVKTFDYRLYAYTSTESVAKNYCMTNLLIEWNHATAIDFRQVGLFYGNSSPVCVYLSENKLISIDGSHSMNFVVVL